VVRGPAAVLIGVGAALAYFLVAPALPRLGSGDAGVLVAGAVGMALVLACATVPVGAVRAPVVLLPALAGAGLIVAALGVAGVGAAATPVEALLYGCIGVGFAVTLDAPALALALPLFVAAIDATGALGGGGGLPVAAPGEPGDALSLDLPGWGGALTAARLGIGDVVFIAVFATYARRFGLRERASILGMLAGLLAALVVTVVLDVHTPALAYVTAGYLLSNADRLAGLFRRAAEG
jgi:hypothetical protein